MVNLQDFFATYDPRWGMLTPTLQEEGYTPAEIEEAKDRLYNAVADPSIAVADIDDKLRLLFAKVWPKNRKELIRAVKQELLDYAEAKIRELLKATPERAAEVLAELIEEGSFIEQRLHQLRQLGSTKAIERYFNYLLNSSEKVEGLKNLIEKSSLPFTSKVDSDFDGRPTSFPMAAFVISDRRCRTGSKVDPDQALNLFRLLEKIAAVGTKKAQTVLSHVYSNSGIESPLGFENISLTLQQRMEGLWRLALAGHVMSQNTLAKFHCNNAFHSYPLQLSDEKRIQAIDRLKAVEAAPYCSVLQKIVARNRIGSKFWSGEQIPLRLTEEQQLRLLDERAAKGDINAFTTLFRAYQIGYLDWCNKTPLSLSNEERVKRLFALQSHNPTCFDELIVQIYVNNCICSGNDYFYLNNTDDERMQFLEKQAFENHNKCAQDILTIAYADKFLKPQFGESKIVLRIDHEQRVEKLHQLADRGCWSPQATLLEYYGLMSRSSLINPNTVHGISCEDTLSKRMGAFDKAYVKWRKRTYNEKIETLLQWELKGDNAVIRGLIIKEFDEKKTQMALSILFALHASMRESRSRSDQLCYFQSWQLQLKHGFPHGY